MDWFSLVRLSTILSEICHETVKKESSHRLLRLFAIWCPNGWQILGTNQRNVDLISWKPQNSAKRLSMKYLVVFVKFLLTSLSMLDFPGKSLSRSFYFYFFDKHFRFRCFRQKESILRFSWNVSLSTNFLPPAFNYLCFNRVCSLLYLMLL